MYLIEIETVWFRAEKHNTKRHLERIYQFDFKMDILMGFTHHGNGRQTPPVCDNAEKDYARELKVLGVELPDASRSPAEFADIKELLQRIQP